MPGDAQRPWHALPLRVYFEDTDAGGVVYYANYLRFAERARTEMMRRVGVESSRLAADHGVVLAVRSCHIDYLKPARLDDALEVRSRIREVGGASVRMDQRICRGADDLVVLDVRLVSVGDDGRTARLPEPLRAALHDMTSDNEAAAAAALTGEQG